MKRAGLSADERDEIVRLLQKFDLPTQLAHEIPRDRIVEALSRDKKFEQGEIRFVVTPKLGTARLSREVTMADLRDAIEQL
jgi:3-dehydroquinate synthetase